MTDIKCMLACVCVCGFEGGLGGEGGVGEGGGCCPK